MVVDVPSLTGEQGSKNTIRDRFIEVIGEIVRSHYPKRLKREQVSLNSRSDKYLDANGLRRANVLTKFLIADDRISGNVRKNGES